MEVKQLIIIYGIAVAIYLVRKAGLLSNAKPN